MLVSCQAAGPSEEMLAPAFAAEPADAQAREGAALTFTAAVVGRPAPALQWERLLPGASAWAAIPGATGAAHTTPALTPADDGTRFRLQISNGAGSARSREALATVTWLHLLGSPADRAVAEGQDATFSAAFEGSPAPALQWQVLPPGGAWADVPGATGPALTWAAAAVSDGGSRVRLAARSAFGEVRSQEALLTVWAHPAVIGFTATPRVTAGEGATLSFSFSGGTGSVSPAVGPVASGASAVVSPAATTTYTLTVTSPAGEVASATARVEVFPAPVITSFAAAEPWVPAGGTTRLTAVFDAGPGGSAAVDGGVGPLQSGVPAATPPLAGPTTYLLTVTNGAGRSVTASAAVDLLVPPAIGAEPADQVAREGGTLTFSATVSGSPAPALQWETLPPGGSSWTPIPGAVATTLPVGPLAPADHGTRYRLRAQNAGGTAWSREAAAGVTWLHLVSSPADLAVTAGRDAAFAASFEGNPAPALQWERLPPGSSTWSAVPGATAASFTWTGPGLADDGARLRLSASNAWGTVHSAEAALGVVAAPAIASFAAVAPRLTLGESTSLTYAFAGGTGAVDGGVGAVTSGGASPVSPAATTTYTLTVTNSLGDTATAAVQVQVFPAPSITSFAAASDHVAPGGSAALTAVFDAGPGGSAAVDGGVGPVQSGVAASTPPVSAPATFTLTVTNGAGRSVTRSLSLDLGIDVFPGDSIQAAIDLAVPGTTVWIHPGTYRPAANAEAMLVMRAGKDGVSLRGTGATPEETVLDGNHQVLHVLFVDTGVGAGTRIDNLTFTGGRAWPGEILPPGYAGVLRPEILSLDDDFYNDGAALMLFSAAPTITRLRVHDNSSFRCGGGISVFAPRGGPAFPAVGPVIRDSEFRANFAGSGTGGAIDVYNNARADIVNDLFVGNFGWGGSIAVLDGAVALIRHCTFDGGANVGAVAATPNAAATIRDSIFVNMTLQPPYDLMSGLQNRASHNCFWNVGAWTPEAGQGHVVADPLFVAGPGGGYYLSQTAAGQAAQSPCVDAGSVDASALPGLTTRTDGASDAGAVDLGYHYLP